MEYETTGPDLLEPGMVLQDRYRIVQRLAQGGFGQIFEVDDNGTTKILKVLLCNYPKAVELFQQEVKILKRLDSPGIPRVDADSYFYHQSEDGEIRHCLVMEKIPGINLQQWMQLRENQPIQEALALDWLRQLAQLLDYVHQHQCFHRDIKPSNILLKPDGQLALIDFGAVRQITESYLEGLQSDRTGTRLQSRGYTPLEQIEGRAVLQSDFFALGRTMVHLLTGIAPSSLPIDLKTGRLIWQEWGSTLSPQLAAVIDALMAPFPGQRPQTAQEILQWLDKGAKDTIAPPAPPTEAPIASLTTEIPPEQSRFGRVTEAIQKGLMRWSGVPLALLWSIVATTGVIGLRWTGSLQMLELMAFDQMMRLRPTEAMDDRLLIVEVTRDDIEQQGGEYPLRDRTLLELLRKLEVHQPTVIGLNLASNFSASDSQTIQDRRDLTYYLQKHDRIVPTCAHPYTISSAPHSHNDISQGIPPPATLQAERLGFISLTIDPDHVIRRHLLAMKPQKVSQCSAFYALSSQLALRYLQTKKVELQFPEVDRWQLGKVQFSSYLNPRESFYISQERLGGHQISLNYRTTSSLEEVAARVTLTQVMTDEVAPDLIQNRIVLVGVTDPDHSRLFETPFRQKMGGLLLHAHMVSQIVSAVENNRPLLKFCPVWIVLLGTGIAAFLISCLACCLHSVWQFRVAVSTSLLIILLASFIALVINGVVMPAMPAIIALIFASVGARSCAKFCM